MIQSLSFKNFLYVMFCRDQVLQEAEQARTETTVKNLYLQGCEEFELLLKDKKFIQLC